jgi:hypothetical protein
MIHPYLVAWQRIVAWVRQSSGVFGLLLVAAYLSVSAGRAVYANYQEQQTILGLQGQLQAAQVQKERLQALLVYYNTTDYQELALRQDLLLQLPGEKVYALPQSSGAEISDEDDTVTSDNAVVAPSKPSTDPFWKQWLTYLEYGKK